MFYESEPSTSLRLGDIVRGFIFAAPCLDKPETNPKKQFSVDIEHPDFAAILTPCCSIERQEIVIAPLRQIRPSFLKNPFLAEDLTRLNRPMKPEHTVPPEAWERMSPDDKIKRFGPDLEKEAYTFLDVFVYAENDLLPGYVLNTRNGKKTVRNYMISFKDITKIKCEVINRSNDSGVTTKLLELSVAAREELRKKLAYYYGRTPAEDKLALGIV